MTKNVVVNENTLVGNDVGVWLSNLDALCNPTFVLTRDVASENNIVNNLVNNTTGNTPTQSYQAGISNQGDGDRIIENNICGRGYTGGISASAALYPIDLTATNKAVVKNNTTCKGPASANSFHRLDFATTRAEGYSSSTLRVVPLQRRLSCIDRLWQR